MAYDTAKDTPKGEDWKFILFVMVYSMREEREHKARMMLTAATLTAGSENKEAFSHFEKQLEEYIDSAYPYAKRLRENKNKELNRVMSKMEGTAYKLNKRRIAKPPWRK